MESQNLFSYWIQSNPTKNNDCGGTEISMQLVMPPSDRAGTNLTTRWSSIVLAKILIGIVRHQHRTDLKQMGRQKKQSEVSKKQRRLFWCNLVSQTGAGATQWRNAAVTCEVKRIPWPTDKHKIKNNSMGNRLSNHTIQNSNIVQTHLPERQTTSSSVWQQNVIRALHLEVDFWGLAHRGMGRL